MAFTKLFVAAVAALSLATSVAAAPVPKVWDESRFEPYDIYHARYNALDCKSKHNTKFFTTCCGPLAHGQPLSTRPAQCNPAAKPSTSNTQDDDDDEDCNEEDDDDDDDDDTNTTTLNPTTTTKPATKTTTKTAAATTTTKASTSSSGGATHKGGRGTWYTQNNQAGACGKKHSDSDLIGAMNFQLYGNVDKVSSTCGKKVLITNRKNGKQVTITLADACPSCPGKNDIDLSTAAFKKLASLDDGVVTIDWEYVN